MTSRSAQNQRRHQPDGSRNERSVPLSFWDRDMPYPLRILLSGAVLAATGYTLTHVPATSEPTKPPAPTVGVQFPGTSEHVAALTKERSGVEDTAVDIAKGVARRLAKAPDRVRNEYNGTAGEWTRSPILGEFVDLSDDTVVVDEARYSKGHRPTLIEERFRIEPSVARAFGRTLRHETISPSAFAALFNTSADVTLRSVAIRTPSDQEGQALIIDRRADTVAFGVADTLAGPLGDPSPGPTNSAEIARFNDGLTRLNGRIG